jgi:hypothetical protein
MSYAPANHYVLTGKGIDAVVDTGAQGGPEGVSLTVDGRKITGAALGGPGNQGFAVTALVVDGGYRTDITVVFPEVRLPEPVITFAAYAVLTTAPNSAVGPAFAGPRQSYEIRPIAGTASDVLG